MELISSVTFNSLGTRQRSRESSVRDPSDVPSNRGSTPTPNPTTLEAAVKETNRTSANFK